MSKPCCHAINDMKDNRAGGVPVQRRMQARSTPATEPHPMDASFANDFGYRRSPSIKNSRLTPEQLQERIISVLAYQFVQTIRLRLQAQGIHDA